MTIIWLWYPFTHLVDLILPREQTHSFVVIDSTFCAGPPLEVLMKSLGSTL